MKDELTENLSGINVKVGLSKADATGSMNRSAKSPSKTLLIVNNSFISNINV
jgi:hypothetical protein